jgi:hypothetical protein
LDKGILGAFVLPRRALLISTAESGGVCSQICLAALFGFLFRRRLLSEYDTIVNKCLSQYGKLANNSLSQYGNKPPKNTVFRQ